MTIIAGVGLVPAGASKREPSDQLPALQDPPATQYRALRRMHAKNDKFNQEAWLEVWTELNGQNFRYEIASERGSEYIRTKVLKTMLIHEQELVSKGEAGRADITSDNYLFEEPHPPAGEFRYVLLRPKRKDMLLVNGRIVLNPDGTELLRVEGTLSKNPSFWTSRVTIIRDFARLEGVRVPVSTATVAKLKFAGEAELDVRYEYQTINGRPVAVATAQREGVYRPGLD